jgi:hypothetical protein
VGKSVTFVRSWILAILVLISCALPRLAAQELFSEKSDLSAVEIDRIYVKGLQYLLRTQAPEGRWSDQPYGAEPAVVGLSIVAMLAHGDDANTGPYSTAIKNGLSFILKQANAKTGYIGRSMYNHAFSTLALAECYGMVNDSRIGPALEAAVKLIVDAQKRNPFGAWRYSPESTDADTTVTGAQLVALFAARNAGIAVPETTIQKGIKFLRSCQTPEGGIGYTQASGPNGARTAIACLVMALAKEKGSKEFRAAFDYLQKAPADSNYAQYYLYYGSQAFFHASPQLWNTWNLNNIKNLRASQTSEGSWEGAFGTTFGTAASLLSLALNYRFLQIYER